MSVSASLHIHQGPLDIGPYSLMKTEQSQGRTLMALLCVFPGPISAAWDGGLWLASPGSLTPLQAERGSLSVGEGGKSTGSHPSFLPQEH